MGTATAAITEVIGKGFGGIRAEAYSQEQAQEFGDTIAHDFMTDASVEAVCVCIDGRNCAHALNSETEAVEQGAHLAGGAITVLAAAELVQWFGAQDSASAYSPEHLDRLMTYATDRKRKLGGHVDSANAAAGFESGTGCGANDKLPEILGHLSENGEAISAFVKTLLGDEVYDDQIMQKIITAAKAPATWNKNGLIDVTKARNENSLEVLRADERGVHGHREQFVVFNYIEGKTVDRDRLVAEKDTQVFTVDMWYLLDIADTIATGPNAAEQARELKHAMVAYQVATYLGLCDGSHRAIVLNQK